MVANNNQEVTYSNQDFDNFSKYSLIIFNSFFLVICLIFYLFTRNKKKHYQKKFRKNSLDVNKNLLL